jgi:hypothetical protein
MIRYGYDLEGKVEGSRPESFCRLASLVLIGAVTENLPDTLVRMKPSDDIEVTVPIIYRDTVIAVREILRQKSPVAIGAAVIVRSFGGTVGSHSYDPGCQAEFEAGETVLLFLDSDRVTPHFGPPHWYPAGGVYSKFTLTDSGNFVQSYEKDLGIEHGGGIVVTRGDILKLLADHPFNPKAWKRPEE